MPTQALPEPDDVRSLLHDLLGRDVTVSRVTAESIDPTKKVVVALYQREGAAVGALVVADIEIAAYAGAALPMLPIGVANENIADGVIEEGLLENFHEVLNVGVRWFTAKGNPRVVLSESFNADAKLPDEVRVVMGGPADRLDVEVTIAGYGSGRMRLLVTSF